MPPVDLPGARCQCGRRWAQPGRDECRLCAAAIDPARVLAGAPLPGVPAPRTASGWPTHRADRRLRRAEWRRRRVLAERERAAAARAKLPVSAVA